MNIGPASVHDYELWGLRQGLFLALQLEIKQLLVHSDSMEVVEALDLSRSPNLPAPAFLLDCYGLLQKFDSYTLRYSPRESNLATDSLARLGHQLNPGVTSFDSAPPEIVQIGRAHV